MFYSDASPAVVTPEEVLDGLSGARDQLRLLEQGMVVLAAEWAKLNPGPGVPEALKGYDVGPAPSRFDEGESMWVRLAAMGCLHVDDMAVPEFAVAAGLPELSARKLLRESLMLIHLLPKVWARVLSGGVDVWRARALAGDCWGLPPEVVAFVDAQMSDVTARITQTSRKRILAEARRQFMAEEVETEEEAAKAQRCAEVATHLADHGIVPVGAQLDLVDALALDAALTVGAEALKELGSDAPLDVRRSWALGDLARSATGHGSLFEPVSTGGECTCTCHALCSERSTPAARPTWTGTGVAPPNVKLFIHIPAGSIRPSGEGAAQGDGTARVEAKGMDGAILCHPDTVRGWFTRPTMAGAVVPPITVRSVLDPLEDRATDSYTPTSKIRDQVHLSTTTCIFPFCNAAAWKCDVDHSEPWKPDGTGGATCTCNLANLCRRHHRVKTHSDNLPTMSGEHSRWTYVSLGGGEYFWRGPRGLSFVRTDQGTYEASTEAGGGAPAHPRAFVAQEQRVEQAEQTIAKLLRRTATTRPVHHEEFAELLGLEGGIVEYARSQIDHGFFVVQLDPPHSGEAA